MKSERSCDYSKLACLLHLITLGWIVLTPPLSASATQVGYDLQLTATDCTTDSPNVDCGLVDGQPIVISLTFDLHSGEVLGIEDVFGVGNEYDISFQSKGGTIWFPEAFGNPPQQLTVGMAPTDFFYSTKFTNFFDNSGPLLDQSLLNIFFPEDSFQPLGLFVSGAMELNQTVGEYSVDVAAILDGISEPGPIAHDDGEILLDSLFTGEQAVFRTEYLLVNSTTTIQANVDSITRIPEPVSTVLLAVGLAFASMPSRLRCKRHARFAN